MHITLSDEARQYIAYFESATDAAVRDCLLFDDRIVLLIAAGEMGTAIGPGGKHVCTVENNIGTTVELVEDAETPDAFVENALAPAVVRHVTLSEQGGECVAYVEIPDPDRGIAIGADGKNIQTARMLARRHYEIDDIQIT
ncbi:NusA-like transcription termination signal-binding factor [Haloquadratum walsbyi]|jgi:NusA family KH domain protein, archaeal|uniref:Probable transcription termination protein NusA n=1 Tax=Haloquadratum walsbyi J07HQW2 TaxID=1238425 RepID=U1NFL3_9EURY|nr:NusA-like transcription termination signal-binding factor [Haloquadratum walsbyi]ERG95608.1 MAG: NusA family KH domain protein, archaeal [Haloquadratum walsbyi J07HQW2]